MKTLYLIAIIAVTFGSSAQELNGTPENIRNSEDTSTTTDEDMVYEALALDTQPEFTGGMAAFREFIFSNFHVSKTLEGPMTLKIYMSFVVDKDGSVTDIKILRNPYGSGEEAKRVLELSPKWKPGMLNGKIVRTQFTLPISINIPAPATSKAKTRN